MGYTNNSQNTVQNLLGAGVDPTKASARQLLNAYFSANNYIGADNQGAFLKSKGFNIAPGRDKGDDYDVNPFLSQLDTDSNLSNDLLNKIGLGTSEQKMAWVGQGLTPASGVTAEMRQNDPAAAAAQYAKVDPPKITSSGGQSPSTLVNQIQNQTTTAPQFTLAAGNLRSGSSGTNVFQLQTLLGGLTADGKYGPKTQAAVKAFQTKYGLTPDGIVGPNTTAMLNTVYGNSNSSNLTAPATGGVGSGVPGAGGSNYTAPQGNSSQINDSYYQGLTQSMANISVQLEAERQRQLDTIQQDKQRAQEELQSLRDQQSDIINEQGKLSIEEKQAKLDALDLETKRFDENYKIVQGLGSQLMDLMNQGNALIASQKGVTGLGVIRNPRVNETINNVTAAVGVIKAGIDVYNGQMSAAQNQLQLATNTLTSAYSDQIDYYKSLSNFYESQATDSSNKLSVLTANEQDFLQSKIASLEADKKRVQDTYEMIQNAMMDPDTALAYASSGVTLNDSPAVINQKLAKYAYSKELADTSTDMALKGYTAAVGGNAPAGSEVVKIIDTYGNVKTYYKKGGSGSGGSGGDTSNTPTGLLQKAINSGMSPEEAALDVAGYYESTGVQIDNKIVNSWMTVARGLKTTVAPVEDTTSSTSNKSASAPYSKYGSVGLSGAFTRDIANGISRFFK
jgi:peptidoglycan hydrolase-like protein with peptidoglycan-binding domain